MFYSEIKKSSEFIVNVPGQGSKYEFNGDLIDFDMKPKNLQNVKKVRFII